MVSLSGYGNILEALLYEVSNFLVCGLFNGAAYSQNYTVLQSAWNLFLEMTRSRNQHRIFKNKNSSRVRVCERYRQEVLSFRKSSYLKSYQVAKFWILGWSETRDALYTVCIVYRGIGYNTLCYRNFGGRWRANLCAPTSAHGNAWAECCGLA
jgi:hypothetical protein